MTEFINLVGNHQESVFLKCYINRFVELKPLTFHFVSIADLVSTGCMWAELHSIAGFQGAT